MNDSSEPSRHQGELPDPFLTEAGHRVSTKREWATQAESWRHLIADLGYGGLPPQPTGIKIETLCHGAARNLPGRPKILSYRVHCLGGKIPFSFCAQIICPQSEEPLPAVICGDGCWRYVSDEVIARVLMSGCALVLFNRTEFAEDLAYAGVPDKNQRKGGLWDAYPEEGFGAVSAWAWGYHRCVDLLMALPFIDPKRLAVTGHSRGSKTVLVAGATDDRIALINDNASGAGGSATFRYVGAGGETLEILKAFPSWFGTGLVPYLGREQDIPYDQHCLLATIAPRPLLLTYALNDRWSNPEGMIQSVWAAREVYRFLGAPENLAFHLREGDHEHALEDWKAFLEFLCWHWFQKVPTTAFNLHPYHQLKPAFLWTAPGEVSS